MKAFEGTMMIHQPLPALSNSTKLLLFAPTLSHKLYRSFSAASPAHEMGYIPLSTLFSISFIYSANCMTPDDPLLD